MLPLAQDLKPNLKAQSKSFHACEECSISQSWYKHASLGVRVGFKKKIGSLSEGSITKKNQGQYYYDFYYISNGCREMLIWIRPRYVLSTRILRTVFPFDAFISFMDNTSSFLKYNESPNIASIDTIMEIIITWKYMLNKIQSPTRLV